MYGIGQGFNEGVKTAGGFLFRALQAKRDDKRFYDQLALEQAWKDGFYGGTSPLTGGDTSASALASGLPAPAGPSGPVPYQVTRNQSPAEILAGSYQNLPSYRGPSPSATPFSTQSSAPHTEQRTFNAPRDPSMVINRMPEVTHTGPSINRIRPNTPLPPISTMRSWFRRGY